MGKEDSNVISLVKDLQRQIGFLEKKIDTLIASSGRPSQTRNYSPASRPLKDRKPYGDKSRSYDRDKNSNETKKEGPKKWYDKKREGGTRGAPRKKKNYKSSRK